VQGFDKLSPNGLRERMKIIFMGTPDFAVPALRALHAAGHEIAAVYSQPPRPGGRRGKELTPGAVHHAALELGLEVRHPVSLKGAEEQAAFAALGADVAVVAAYGLILPQAILDAPRLGCINLHASLLPRWRGAAPIQRAVLAGDAQTGITVMQMDAGLDTGAMLVAEATPVAGKTAGELTVELAEIGARLIVAVLADPAAYPPLAQPDEGATYARKIDKAEALLDFAADAEQVERQVRAMTPAPGAYFTLDGERYKVITTEIVDRSGAAGTVLDEHLTIACGAGAIRPTRIQRAGKPAMATIELLRGMPITRGTVLNREA
jgi:methionyl-tRNA formyltransferase